MNEKGTALVEAAIVIPLLLLLLVGFVEMGILVNTKMLANESARAAAREYIRTEDQVAAREKAEYVADLEYFQIKSSGSMVAVETVVRIKALLPGVWKLFGGQKGGMTVNGKATFRMEPR